MKIAISCKGNDLNAKLDPRFGRAAGFIIYDTVSGNYEYLSNEENLNAPQGAGVQTAQKIANSGVQAVISGHVGPKAFSALNAGKIEVYLSSQSRTVQEAASAFKNGELSSSSGADRPGRW